MNKFFAAAGIAGALIAGSASAIDIDFTSNYYAPFIPGNTNSTGWISVDNGNGLDIALSSTGGNLQYWQIEGGVHDGIGVGDDEILENKQSVKVSFDESVYIYEINILDLFYELNDQPVTPTVPNAYYEVGYYAVDGGLNVYFQASGTPADQPRGSLTINAHGVKADYITFTSEVQTEAGDNDYALAGLKVAKVPEPATISLLGLGLVALTGASAIRRRRS
jgi:hypothetical protein